MRDTTLRKVCRSWGTQILQGPVAQLVERSTENRKVTGSTPVGATRPFSRLLRGGGRFFMPVCPSFPPLISIAWPGLGR